METNALNIVTNKSFVGVQGVVFQKNPLAAGGDYYEKISSYRYSNKGKA
jgi:hypothetical protein